jgi:diguanylate cyclase (GGDEF)-like protein
LWLPRLGGRARPGLPARVLALVGSLAALATAVYAGVIHALPAEVVGPVQLPWWAFAIFFYVAEAYVVHLHFRSEAHTLSLSEFGLVVGLFCTSPRGLVAAQLCGATAALLIHRRQRPVKVAFNIGLFALCTSLALAVFHGLADLSDPYGARGLAAAFLAVAFASLTGVVLVALAISLAEGKPVLSTVPTTAVLALVSGAASASLALATVELLRLSPWLIVLEILPAASCGLAFLAYTVQRRRHEHLGLLYESMRATQAARDFESVIREFLGAAKQMFRADVAELIVFPAFDADQALRSVTTPDGETLMQPTQLSLGDRWALESASARMEAILLPRSRRASTLDGYLGERGIKDALVTALRGETGVFGLLLVGDRAGDVSTFDHDDRKLFETFASHASVLLENDRLEQSLAALSELQDQLRHQAFHDALTGLPNRVLFTDRVGETLARAADGAAWPAVLFLDLDDFKSINDTLGHAAGDELLTAVAGRVRASVRPGDIPARLGGDEFAVLIENAVDGEPERVAARLVEALRAPFSVQGREVAVTGSVGIASAELRTETADELLRNADIAMYGAKANGKRGFAAYEPQMHDRMQRRHELAAALDRALDRNEIHVHYQPIVTLADGRTVAVEALARWRHPERGLVPPTEFIPVAEETGLMIPIGRAILEQACATARDFQKRFPAYSELAVSVNLSQCELQDAGFVEHVAFVLETTGLAPSCLILELTEHGAMSDPDGTVATLHDLRRLGVRLALDDFGTGHSSLSHLRTFPFDILKIAKPFVDKLRHHPPDPTFVDAIVGLAISLGLETVAEGIEHRSQADDVRGLRCGYGQGYHFARPLDAAGLEEHLRSASGPADTVPAGTVPAHTAPAGTVPPRRSHLRAVS